MITKHELARIMYDLFKGRESAYALKSVLPDGKKVYFPARDDSGKDMPFSPDICAKHLAGEVSIGVYPIDENNNVSWVAFDFDGKKAPTALQDAVAVKKVLEKTLGIISYLEISQSGNGIHLWIFLDKPLPAKILRAVFISYVPELNIPPDKRITSLDRMFPNQDSTDGGYGNLCALPLNGPDNVVKNKTTVFINDAGIPYEDQKKVLAEAHTSRNTTIIFEDQYRTIPPAERRAIDGARIKKESLSGGAKVISDYGCRWLKKVHDQAVTVAEPEWYDALCELSQLESGRLLAHEISKGYPKYSEEETNKKFDHAIGANKPLRVDTVIEKYGECPGGCVCKKLGLKFPYEIAKIPVSTLTQEQGSKVWSSSDLADKAIDAAKEISEGKRMGFPWGYDILDDATELRPSDLIVVAARRSIGKALAHGQPILTTVGWINVEQLRVGNYAFSVDGKPTKITGVYPQGIRKLFKVVFSDNTSLVVDENHLWFTQTKYERTLQKITGKETGKVRTTRELMNTLYASKKKEANHSIPIATPVEFKKSFVPIDPYVLGCWLGDGDGVGRITATPDLWKILKRCDIKLGREQTQKGNKATTRAILGLGEILRTLGLFGCRSYEKFIPDCYLYGSVNQRLELLQGLLDTDGYISDFGCIQYYTTSKTLASQVAELVRSLGGIVRISGKYGTLYGKKHKYCWILTVRFPNNFKMFRLPKKLDRTNTRSVRSGGKLIKQIKYVGKGEATCISVTNSSGLFITKDYIVTHNTAMAIDASLNGALKGIPQYFVSMEMSAEQLAMRYLANISEVDHTVITTGKMGEMEWRLVNAGASVFRELPLFIDDRIMDFEKMLDTVGELILQYGPGTVWVDYLQLVKKRGMESKKEAVDRAIDGYKSMAKILKVPVVTLAQLNRKEETYEGDEELDSWLKDSGDIEQTADVILYIRGKRGPGTVVRRINIHKERHREAHINLKFDFRQGIFKFSPWGKWTPQDEEEHLMEFELDGLDQR